MDCRRDAAISRFSGAQDCFCPQKSTGLVMTHYHGREYAIKG